MYIPFITPRFDDEQIDRCVMSTLTNDGLFDVSQLAVSTEQGVITIKGRTRNRFEKQRIGSIAHTSLTSARLRYQAIVDELVVE